ncbi:helix-turn-helix transcriptional regulator [Actinomycetes bacterium KLBMP 9797]
MRDRVAGGAPVRTDDGISREAGDPSARQRLAAELRQLRGLAGVSGRQLAQRIKISQSKVSRIESGTALPSLPEALAWADATGASRKVREQLATLTEAAFTEVNPWREALATRPHLQDETGEREAKARTIRTFHPAAVPGLLQTAEYARRVFSLSEVSYAEEDIAGAVAARLRRQLALYEEDRQFHFLISEGALRWRPGPARVLLAQLDRVASVSTLDNVTVGLVLYGREMAACPSHGFTLYEGDAHGDSDAHVGVETTHANLIVNHPDDVALYRRKWLMLSRTAIYQDEAREFIAQLGAEIRATAQ